MSIGDKTGLLLIKKSIRHMDKDKMLGLLAIVISYEKDNPKESEEIINYVKNEYERRRLNLDSLNGYIKECRKEWALKTMSYNHWKRFIDG